MWEGLKNLSDLAKFIIMLLVYTGTMMWWASSLNVQVIENAEYRKEDTKIVSVISQQLLVNTKYIDSLQKQLEVINTFEQENIKMHAKCAALMDVMIDRVNKVEDRERKEGHN